MSMLYFLMLSSWAGVDDSMALAMRLAIDGNPRAESVLQSIQAKRKKDKRQFPRNEGLVV